MNNSKQWIKSNLINSICSLNSSMQTGACAWSLWEPEMRVQVCDLHSNISEDTPLRSPNSRLPPPSFSHQSPLSFGGQLGS